MKSYHNTCRAISLVLACLVLLSSVGVTIDLHFCRGQLKTFSLFGKAKSCHEMGQGMKDCPYHKTMLEASASEGSSLGEKGCCSNTTLHFQSDQDQQKQMDEAVVRNTSVQHFVVAFVASFLNSAVMETTVPFYAHYQPPAISRDIYVLLETYRL